MKWLLLLCLSVLQCAAAGLERDANLVAADPSLTTPPAGALRITYLGTNGYRFGFGRHVLLVDPDFSRVGVAKFAFNTEVQPNITEIEKAAQFVSGAEAILVSHGHVDHLLDVPPIMQMTGARLLASRTAVALATAAGASAARCAVVRPGDVRQIGPWKVRVLAATHDRVFPIGVPFPGPRKSSGAPRRAGDWVCGQPLAFLIEAGGKRVYIDSGGSTRQLPPNDFGSIDLAILGVALPDARARFAEAVRRLQPRFILPSHQDNFFRPLERGFSFGPLTDFPRVLRDDARERLPGCLILLDYFRPWTLP